MRKGADNTTTKGKGTKKDKQWQTKDYTENLILSNTKPTTKRGELMFFGWVSSLSYTSGTRRDLRLSEVE